MKIFRRVMYSLFQQKQKSLILFCMIFVLGNILSSAVALSYSIKNVKQEFMESYGTRIWVQSTEKYQSRLDASFNEDERINQSVNVFDQLLKHDYVTYGDYSYLLSGLQSDRIRFHEKQNTNEKEFENIQLWGTEHSEPLDFKNKEVILTEGRYFTEKELKTGAQVILISDSFKLLENGEYRAIKPHDHLVLKRNIYPLYMETDSSEDILYSENVEYEVIGVFKINELLSVQGKYNQIDYLNARIYTPNQTVFNEAGIFEQLDETYAQDKDHVNHAISLGTAYFQLTSPNVLEYMEGQFEPFFQEEILPYGYRLFTSNDIYEKISGPVNAIENIGGYLLSISFICSILILNFVIFFLTKDRKYEVGVLLALGEKRRNILLQIILEVWMIGIIALNLSIISGNKLGEAFSNYLVNSSYTQQTIQLSEEEDENQKKLLEQYHVVFDHQYVLLINEVGSLILFLSTALSIGFMMQAKPKKILLDSNK